MLAAPTHFAFSDESQYNFGRYRGIALVSLSASDYGSFDVALRNIVKESGLKEFKWNKLRTARERLAAIKLIEWALKEIGTGRLRIDVLVWDTEDSRHRFRGRDDDANLQRMYYHLFKNVLRERWADGSWRLFPDEQSAIKWDELDECLDRSNSSVTAQKNIGDSAQFRVAIKNEFSVHQISPCCSHEQPFVQLADLFVGLSLYSRASYECYEQYIADQDRQSRLFKGMETRIKLSSADKERCLVLLRLDDRCKRQRIQVSLKSHRGLRTMNPKFALNFWWYEPQTEKDKAPTKVALRRSSTAS